MRNPYRHLLIAVLCLTPLVAAFAQDMPDSEPAENVPVTTQIPYTPPEFDALTCSRLGTPKNVILFIGDGMSISQIHAGKVVTVGQRGKTYIELCDYLAFATTYSANRPITDSAASATALATGHKTDSGMVGVTPSGEPLRSIVQDAKALGKSTGVLANARVTHATPAGFYARAESRGDNETIARSLVGSGLDLLMGGGQDHFTTLEADGARTLWPEFAEDGYRYVTEFEDLEDMRLEDGKILALLAEGHMPPSIDAEPRLAEMTKRAIELLSRNEDGFFLMVEGSMIDWAGHENNAQYLVDEQVAFDLAVGEGLKFAEADGDTLVLVTGDHETGGLAIIGEHPEERKATLAFTTGGHTGIMLPVAAAGVGAPAFHGFIDQTDIPNTIRRLWYGE